MLCPSGEKRTYNDNQPSKFMISHKSFSNINRNKMVKGVDGRLCTMLTCFVGTGINKQVSRQ